MNNACVLATLDSTNEDERVVVLLDRGPAGETRISLEQQTWAGRLGWFNQARVELEPQQIAALRNVLGQSTQGVKLAASPRCG